MNDDLLNTAELAEWLRVPVRTIEDWRSRGKCGPNFIRIGGHVRYRRSTIERWLDSLEVAAA